MGYQPAGSWAAGPPADMEREQCKDSNEISTNAPFPPGELGSLGDVLPGPSFDGKREISEGLCQY